MKKTLLLAGVLLALTATVAMAGGVNFSWNNLCYTEGPVVNKTFACNVNTTTATYQWPMTMSFAIDAEMTDMVGIEITLEGQSDQPVIPDWWKLGATDCRPNMMTYSADKSTVATEVCNDWTGGVPFAVFGYTWDTNRAHVLGGAAIDASLPFDMLPGLEYYAGTLTLKNSKTVGTGACTGCAFGFKWGLTLVTAAGLSGRRDNLDIPLPGGNQCLSWNNSILPCDKPVPAKNTTWGQVKSLYR
jgi:hypothetical protein